jgi:hypothetical protein
MRKFTSLFFLIWLTATVWANPMRFGRTDSPGSFRVDLPGSWVRSKVDGCFEDVLGCRLQAIIAPNTERTVENTYPAWQQRFQKQGYEVKQVDLGGVPALLAKGPDNCLGIILRKGHQINLMLNVSSDAVKIDDLMDPLVRTFIWMNP